MGSPPLSRLPRLRWGGTLPADERELTQGSAEGTVLRDVVDGGAAILTAERAEALAAQSIAGWNAHDLGAILRHYANAVPFTSPMLARPLDVWMRWRRRTWQRRFPSTRS